MLAVCYEAKSPRSRGTCSRQIGFQVTPALSDLYVCSMYGTLIVMSLELGSRRKEAIYVDGYSDARAHRLQRCLRAYLVEPHAEDEGRLLHRIEAFAAARSMFFC